jgi:hypothetical protein
MPPFLVEIAIERKSDEHGFDIQTDRGLALSRR